MNLFRRYSHVGRGLAVPGKNRHTSREREITVSYTTSALGVYQSLVVDVGPDSVLTSYSNAPMNQKRAIKEIVGTFRVAMMRLPTPKQRSREEYSH